MTRQTDLMNMNYNADQKDYKFILVTNSGGIVPIIVQLEYAPDGWTDEVVFERNKRYKGVFRKYADAELKFVKDGRDTVKNIYESKGIDAESILNVYKLNHSTFEYDLIFMGKLDFSTYKIDETSVSIQVMDNNFAERLKNLDNVTLNLLSNETLNGHTVKAFGDLNTHFAFPQLDVKGVAQYDGDDYTITTGSLSVAPHYNRLQLNLGYSEIAEAETQTKETTDFFLRNAADSTNVRGNLTMSGRIKIPTALVASYTYKFIIRGASSGDVTVKSYSVNPNDNDWQRFEFTEQTSEFAITAGDDLHLDIEVDPGTWPGFNDGYYLEVDSTDFQLEYELSDIAITQCTGLPYYEALLRACQKITNTQNCFYSDFFGRTDSELETYASDGQLGHITKGLLVRGADIDFDVTLSVTLEDLFSALDCLFMIGLGVEYDAVDGYRVRVEDLEYFFDDTVVLDISDRISESEVTKEVLPEWHYSQIKTGYSTYEYEVNGGIFEYNSKQTYSTPIGAVSNIDNTLDLVNPYRADTNGLIVLRQNHRNVVSDEDRGEDVDGDDDIFLVDTVRDPLLASNFRARTDEGFDHINGYTASTTKNNYFYTPKRCMLRHGRVIRAGLEKTLNRYVKFQDNDKTVSLATRLATESENVVENTDTRINDLDTPWWWAEAYEVEAPFYSQDMQDVDDNPRGLIKLSDTKYGWILEIKTSADNKAKIKLLRANLDYITPS